MQMSHSGGEGTSGAVLGKWLFSSQVANVIPEPGEPVSSIAIS